VRNDDGLRLWWLRLRRLVVVLVCGGEARHTAHCGGVGADGRHSLVLLLLQRCTGGRSAAFMSVMLQGQQ